MKDSLMLKKYKTEKVPGTYNLIEEKTFFGTKIMDIEDYIEITDKSIQYYELNVSGTSQENNGYQYYELNTFIEDVIIQDIVNIKNENHTIKKTLQSKETEINNTHWKIKIDIKSILSQYIFGKIKETRTFKSIESSVFINRNINKSIYEYIENNILDRYELDNIELYVKYIDIKNNIIYSNLAIKQYDPLFNQSIEIEENRVRNTNLKLDLYLDKLAPITVDYYQTKSSTEYKFDYYFNLYFKKI
jgi:hypothetical protein